MASISLEALQRQLEAAKALAREARAATYVLTNAARWEENPENKSTYEATAKALQSLTEEFWDEVRRGER